MTAYDAYGYPQQVVDPGVAVAGAAAAGLIGYGLANNLNHHSHYRHYPRYSSYQGGYYHRPTYYRGHHYRGHHYGGHHYRHGPSHCYW